MYVFMFRDVFPFIVICKRYVPGDLSESHVVFCLLLHVYLRFKVVEHSFEVPMRNSPLILNHLCFGERFLQEVRLTTERFILAFWLRCVSLLLCRCHGNGAG